MEDITSQLVALVIVGGVCGAALEIPGLMIGHAIMLAAGPMDFLI
jgi:hypothetical protein